MGHAFESRRNHKEKQDLGEVLLFLVDGPVAGGSDVALVPNRVGITLAAFPGGFFCWLEAALSGG